jgi:hypothetical protein
MNSSTSLSDDDIACGYSRTVRLLDTKSLGLTVSAVFGGADTLLMSKELQGNSKHYRIPP